jgi:adenylate kinase
MNKPKIVVALYGLPGSGKGTQANLLTLKYGLTNFDTGKLLESIWHDPKRQKEALVIRERALFDNGVLNTPSFVLGEVRREAQSIAKNGAGIVFSGSPRTLEEAEGLIPALDTLYGKERLLFFEIKVDESDSMARNSKRLLCTKCKTGVMTLFYPKHKPTHCPNCAGELYRRSVDDPKIIPKRLEEYRVRTHPVISYLKKSGYPVKQIDGKRMPWEVFESIDAAIQKRLKG